MNKQLIQSQELVDGFLGFLPTQPSLKPKLQTASSVDENMLNQLVKKCEGHSLWGGDWQNSHSGIGNSLSTQKEYPSQSEADFALINFIADEAVGLGIPENQLSDAISRTFELSGLYRPEKSTTLINHTIPKAIANAVSRIEQTPKPIEPEKLPRLDSKDGVVNFSITPPPKRDFTLDDLILAHKVCVLAGLGGVSKTMWMLQLCICIALGLPLMGKATKMGAVLLILGEEDMDEITRRLGAIALHMRLTPQQINLVKERIRAFPMNGLDARLTKVTAGSLEGTEFAVEIIKATKQLEDSSGCKVRLIGLDHAGLIHGGEFNSREDVVQTMRQVTRVSKETEASVLVLAHSPKNTIIKEKSDAADVAGSAAWVDLARGVFVLRTMNEGDCKSLGIPADKRHSYVSFSVVKNNYGPTGESFWLERVSIPSHEVSVLQTVTLVKPVPQPKGGAQLQSLIITKISQHPAKYSKSGFRDTHHGKAGPLKASKSEIDVALDDLLNQGRLILRAPTDAERKQHGLHHQTKQVLEVK
jgi:hypothetical protein